MSLFRSMNPKNNQLLRSFNYIKDIDLDHRLQRAENRFKTNEAFTVDQLPERHQKLQILADILEKNKDKYSKLITNEMGKPISQSIFEIEKAQGHINYYIKKSREFLKTEVLNLSSGENGAVFLQPLGPTLGKLGFLIILHSYRAVQFSVLDAIQVCTWRNHDWQLDHHETFYCCALVRISA